MKLSLKQKELKESLGNILGTVRESGISHLSSTIKIQTEGEEIFAYMGNGDSYIRQKVPGDIALTGACALYGKSLFDLVSNLLTTEPVDLIFDEGRLVVKQNRLRYKIPTMPITNFWHFDPVGESSYVAINPKSLIACIDAVSYAASKDTGRNTASVLIEPKGDGKIRAVATDNLRLVLRNEIGVVNAPFLISPNNAKSLRKYLADKTEMGMFVDTALVHILTPEGFLKLRRIDKDYVNYRGILPQGPHKTIKFNTAEVSAALHRMTLFDATKASYSVAMHVQAQMMKLELRNKDGEGEEVLAIESDSPDAIVININPKQFIEVLEHTEGEMLMIRYYGPTAPIIITDNKESLTLLSQVSVK